MTTASTDILQEDTRESVARHLLALSAKHSFDPAVEVRWDDPLEPEMPYLPEHLVSLYDTPLWNGMTRAQRVELSRLETASVTSCGIWLENVLLQMLTRHIYRLDQTSEHVAFALTEIGDECRHSVMFGRQIAKLGAPAYGPGRTAMRLGGYIGRFATGPEMFAVILLAEEIFDHFNRASMHDEGVQPLVREVSRIHVVEESRHVRFAREELARQIARCSRIGMVKTRLTMAESAYWVASRFVNPQAYADAGLDPRQAVAQRKASPHYAASMQKAASKAVVLFDDLGLMKGPGLARWRAAKLIP
jgi:P-aminobenzoate N-oxygenase AurF